MTPPSRADVRDSSLLAAAIVFLTPASANAFGEQYLINVFVGAVLVPAWATFAFVSARRRVPAELRRHLGLATVACSLIAVGWACIGSASVFDNFYYAPVLSPL